MFDCGNDPRHRSWCLLDTARVQTKSQNWNFFVNEFRPRKSLQIRSWLLNSLRITVTSRIIDKMSDLLNTTLPRWTQSKKLVLNEQTISRLLN